MATIVYRYGLLAPHENAHLVRSQMRAAHAYRNDLVYIERERRAVLRSILSAHANVAELEAAMEAAEAEAAEAATRVAAARSAGRTRKAPKELTDALAAAREKRKDASKRLSEARAIARAETVPQVALLNERAAEMRRGARALTTAFWGSYLAVEASDEQARGMPLYEFSEPNDPKFVRWTGEGFVSVQLQGGLTGLGADDIALDRRLRIEPVAPPPGVDPKSKRSARRRYAVLAMRVGSEGRDPIWARWKMVMHRPLPSDAKIKWARVQVRRIGPIEEWFVVITLETNQARRPVPESGVVAMDLGWRSMASGLRVGAWVGSDGEHGFAKVPDRVPSAIEKCESLASIRDRAFDEARAGLVKWISSGVALPGWFTEATSTLAQWKSIGRLASLVHRWRDARFDGDEMAYGVMEKWRYHDHHLWQWQETERTKSLRSRKDSFRVLAANLAKRYRFLVLEDLDLRTWAKKKPADGEDHLRYQRAVAAPSELREALLNAFGGSGHPFSQNQGVRVLFENPMNTTRECNACGSIEAWDQAADVVHTCRACQTTWDQDTNAALVMLKRSGGRVREADAALARADGSSGEKGGRWARAKAKRREKIGGSEPAGK